MATLTTQTSTISDAQETELTFQPSDFSFLSQLLHILQKVETGDDPQEIATLAANLKASFKKCQTILDHLPGADLSPDEQARILEEELKVLEKKKAQLSNYLSWQVFQCDSPTEMVKHEQDSDTLLPQPLTLAPVSVPGINETTESAPMPIPIPVGIGSHPSDQMDEVMVDYSEIGIKDEYKESTPSLATDVTSLSESSQSFVPSSQPTGLSLPLADVKMEEDQSTM
ncbi:hypothetical protein BGX34_009523 [Mortierella sp. NVP85]|nr:hypothetical protein BGX34_009523 [Mortierella sp. NVP85]